MKDYHRQPEEDNHTDPMSAGTTPIQAEKRPGNHPQPFNRAGSYEIRDRKHAEQEAKGDHAKMKIDAKEESASRIA